MVPVEQLLQDGGFPDRGLPAHHHLAALAHPASPGRRQPSLTGAAGATRRRHSAPLWAGGPRAPAMPCGGRGRGLNKPRPPPQTEFRLPPGTGPARCRRRAPPRAPPAGRAPPRSSGGGPARSGAHPAPPRPGPAQPRAVRWRRRRRRPRPSAMWSWRRPTGPARPTATKRRAGRAAARAGRGRPCPCRWAGRGPGRLRVPQGPGPRCRAAAGARQGRERARGLRSVLARADPAGKSLCPSRPGAAAARGSTAGPAGGDSHGPHAAGRGSRWVCGAVPVCPGVSR